MEEATEEVVVPTAPFHDMESLLKFCYENDIFIYVQDYEDNGAYITAEEYPAIAAGILVRFLVIKLPNGTAYTVAVDNKRKLN